EAVLAALGLQRPIGVLALDGEGRALQPSLLARAGLEQLALETAIGGPALVHAEHHLPPVLGVRAAGARLERARGRVGVVLAVEERRLLQALELAAQRRERRRDLVGQRRVELVEAARVLVFLRQPLVVLELLGGAGVLGADLLRPGLVVPE